MKQIFDWLREKMRNKSHKAWDGDNKKEIMLLFLPDVEEFINEAEAKWESEVCEWKHGRHYVNCFCRCYGIMIEHDLAIGFKFCPYCGKPIKISEVE